MTHLIHNASDLQLMSNARQIGTLDTYFGNKPIKGPSRTSLPPKCSEDELQTFMAAYRGIEADKPKISSSSTALRSFLCEVLSVPGITMRRLWDIAGAYRTTKNTVYDIQNLAKNPYLLAKESPPLISYDSCVALERKYGFAVKPADIAGALVVDRLYNLVSGSNTPFVSVHKFEAALRQCERDHNESLREAVRAEVITTRFGSQTMCTTRSLWRKMRYIESEIETLTSESLEDDETTDWDTTFTGHCGKLEFNDQQKEACIGIFNYSGLAITGGAGTGKTTVIAAINSALMSQGTMVFNLAFSGKAVKVLRERLPERAHCYTLHRFLRTIIHENEELDFDSSVVICDEASMVDIALFEELLRHIDTSQSRVIFVGDPRQLPPVGLGSPFNDLIDAIKEGRSKFPHVELTTTNRYAEDMARFVEGIDQGQWNPPACVKHIELPPLPLGREQTNSWFVALDALQSTLKSLLIEHPELRDLTKTMYLAAQHEYVCGTSASGALLQDILNQNGVCLPNCTPRYGRNKGTIYREGDSVVRIINSYGSGDTEDHYNGDDGELQRSEKPNKYVVKYTDGTMEEVRSQNIRDDFELGYVRTVHKSQGGEINNVVIFGPVNCHGMWRRAGGRRLLTVAVSRAKQTVYILGHASAIAECLQSPDDIKIGKMFSNH